MADESEKPTNSEVDGSDITTNWDECTTTFDSMDLKEDLLRGIYAYGFEKPSAIQQVCDRLPKFLTRAKQFFIFPLFTCSPP